MLGPRLRELSIAALVLVLSLAMPSAVPGAIAAVSPQLATSAAWRGRVDGYGAGDPFGVHNPHEDDNYAESARDPSRGGWSFMVLAEDPYGVDPWGRAWRLRAEKDASAGRTRTWVTVFSGGPDGRVEPSGGDDVVPRGCADQGTPERIARATPFALLAVGALFAWLTFTPRDLRGRRVSALIVGAAALFAGRGGALGAGLVLAWLLHVPRLLGAPPSRRLHVEALRVLGVGLLPALVAGALAFVLHFRLPRLPGLIVSQRTAVACTAFAACLLFAAMLRVRYRNRAASAGATGDRGDQA